MVVVIRAATGPIQFGVMRVGSPFSAETIFALCFLGLVLTGAATRQEIAGGNASLLLAVALAVIGAAFARNLADPFLSDDHILVSRAAADPSLIWRSFQTAGGDGAFRPIGYLYFDLIKLWAHTDPLRWHICGLAVHLLNCCLLFCLTLRLWTNPLVAFAATLVFGLHGTRPEAVTWTAGSFDLLATLFVLGSATLFFLPMRHRVLAQAGALALLLPAVLAKESAYVYPLLVLGLAAASRRVDRRTVRFVALATFECAILFAYRWSLFHGPGGYVDPATGRPQIYSLHVLPALKALTGRIWAILLFPVNWDAPTGAAVAIAIAIGCGVLLYIAVPRNISLRAALGLTATVAGCMLPVLPLALIGESELGSRILYLPSIAFSILIGLLAGGRRLILMGLMVSLAGVLTHNLSAWHETAVAADAACKAASEGAVRNPPPTLNGVHFFANGFEECVQMRRAH